MTHAASEIYMTDETMGDLADALDRTIARGLNFLRSQQRANGSFAVFKSLDRELRELCMDDTTPFGTALVSYCLSFSSDPIAQVMIDRAIQHLCDEMSGPGVWRYWTKEHPYFNNIPPDLDDMSCISELLRLRGIPFPDNRSLFLANRDHQGLFYTWLIPRFLPIRVGGYWRTTLPQLLKPIRYLFWLAGASNSGDVDGIVNANVLFYLGDIPETRPLVSYLTNVLRNGEEVVCDKWYHSLYTFCYAVSRCCSKEIPGLEEARERIIQRITEELSRNDSEELGPTDLALAACALMNCQSSPILLEEAICKLISAQHESGEWSARWFYDAGFDTPPRYGSEELTTGFCLEALIRFRTQFNVKAAQIG
jgi:hypothetical protein